MQNLISFFEIPCENFDRAVKFYSEIFSYKFEICDCETEKMAFFSNGEGAISCSKDFKPSKDGVLIHFNVANLDNMIAQIEKCGGKIIIPKTKIIAEGRGWFATFSDTEGNTLGIYEPLK